MTLPISPQPWIYGLLKMEIRNPSWFIKNIIQAIGNVPPDEVVIIVRFIDSRIMSKKEPK